MLIQSNNAKLKISFIQDFTYLEERSTLMIIYNESSSKFINHVLEQRIESVLLEKVQEKMNHSVSPSEIRSWTNSLPQMAKILRDADLKEGTHVLLEYKLPSTEKRIDFLITGEDKTGRQNAVIVELKQ